MTGLLLWRHLAVNGLLDLRVQRLEGLLSLYIRNDSFQSTWRQVRFLASGLAQGRVL